MVGSSPGERKPSFASTEDDRMRRDDGLNAIQEVGSKSVQCARTEKVVKKIEENRIKGGGDPGQGSFLPLE